MRKPRRQSFADLVLENKRQLLSNETAMEKIEKRIEDKAMRKAQYPLYLKKKIAAATPTLTFIHPFA